MNQNIKFNLVVFKSFFKDLQNVDHYMIGVRAEKNEKRMKFEQILS